MFGRKKTTDQTHVGTEVHPPREGAKNRPTPKRRDQEAARRQPLVQTDRKKARSDERAHRAEQRALVQKAMLTGDDRYLPARDKGPVRRFVRDFVDSRRNVGEFMLPIMLITLALSFVRTSWALTLSVVLIYGLVGVAVIDTWFMWRGLKKALVEKYGQVERGLLMYAVTRAFQMRRTRAPRPLVGPGKKPA